MPNCKNDPSKPIDRWDSFVNGNREGYFKILQEDPMTGVCSGNFFDNGGASQPVTGRCDGVRIRLYLTIGGTQYTYVGVPVGNEFIGFRFPPTRAASKTRVVALAGPDDWTGDNPATLLTKVKKRAGKKAAGKKASGKKAAGKRAAGKEAATKKKIS